MNKEKLRLLVREVHDFPKKGIIFKDLTTVFKDKEGLNFLTNQMYDKYKDLGITKVIGVESRGFIMGGIIANKLDAGMILIRKKGKLPADTYVKNYDLEYGESEIEIHKDALTSEDVVLLHDDLLATGGTIKASLDLVNKFNVKKIYISFIIDLTFLNDKKVFEGYDVHSILKY